MTSQMAKRLSKHRKQGNNLSLKSIKSTQAEHSFHFFFLFFIKSVYFFFILISGHIVYLVSKKVKIFHLISIVFSLICIHW